MKALPELPSLSLSGRVALVTGAAGGIGAAVAKLFVAAGAAVALCDRDDQADGLKVLSDDIEASGGKALPLAGDVCDRSAMFGIAQTVSCAFGHPDILVACAGMYPTASAVMDIDKSHWDIAHNVNVKGVLFACQSVLPAMITRNSGNIVAISSDSAFDVICGESAYGISKMSGAKLIAYLARELAGNGIRANAIARGYVRTAMTEPVWRDPVAHAAAIEGIPPTPVC